MQKPWQAATLGALIAALLTLPGLAIGTLWDNSETAYGEVAKEILIYHDAVVMHLNGAPWFVQPPLYFWIAAAFAKLLGIGTLAFRLPSALATIAMSAMTGYAVARSAGARAGAFSAVILSTSLMQIVVGRLAIMDALLDLAVALTIFWWYRGVQTGRSWYFLAGCAAVAFGCLAKGPVALAIVLLVVVPFYFWNRRHESVYAPKAATVGAGVALFCVITFPWFFFLMQREGTAAVWQLIGHYTFGRYTGTIENQAGPLWYYLPVLILGFFPWCAFLPAAIVYGTNQLTGRAPSDAPAAIIRLALLWIALPFLFFSFAKTKLPNYIALEFPALSVITALYFHSIVERYRRRSLMISAAVVPVVIALLGVAIAIFVRQNRITADLHRISDFLLAAGLMIFAAGVIATVLFASERRARFGPYALASGTLLAIFLLFFATQSAEQFKPIPRLASIINARRSAADVVAIQGVPGGNALLFYTRPGVKAIAGFNDTRPDPGLLNAREIICTGEHAFLVTSKRRPANDPAYGRTRKLLATDNNDILYIYSGRCQR